MVVFGLVSIIPWKKTVLVHHQNLILLCITLLNNMINMFLAHSTCENSFYSSYLMQLLTFRFLTPPTVSQLFVHDSYLV